jgi:LPS sulfotransferase NodH
MNTLIFAPARSGSTSLYNAIHALAGMKPDPMGMEPFDPQKTHASRKVSAITTYTIRKVKIVKHLWNQVSPADNQEIIRAAGIRRIILLYRRQVFSQAISRLVARVTREWAAPVAADQAPFAIYNDTVLTQIQYFIYSARVNTDIVKAAGVPAMVSAYEDLYSQRLITRRAELRRIIRFLGLYRPDVDAAMEMLNPKNKYKDIGYYRHVLLNFNDLFRLFGAYDRYFDDPGRRPETILRG